MKNIGIFTHDLYPFKPWGQGRYVSDLARHLRRKKPDNIFVFSPSENIIGDHHVQIFPGSHDTIGKNISFSIKLAGIIEKLIRKYNLGLVHFQGGPGGLFLLKKTSVPLVYTVHHTYYQQSVYIRAQRWKKSLCPWEWYGYHKSAFLMCNTNSTRQILVRHYRVNPSCCKTIPVGVDQKRFFSSGAKQIPNSLFFLGRLEERKGIDFLLRTIPLIKKRLNDIQLFVGGSGALYPFLSRYTRDNHLEENVHFLGTIDDALLNEWYNKVSLIVVPSVFEGFGLTAVEAMACGTPVIASNADGLRDVIEDGINGFLVPYNDVSALSTRILDLLENGSGLSKLSKNGKKKVATVFNWDIISKDVLAVYENVMKNA